MGKIHIGNQVLSGNVKMMEEKKMVEFLNAVKIIECLGILVTINSVSEFDICLKKQLERLFSLPKINFFPQQWTTIETFVWGDEHLLPCQTIELCIYKYII